MPGVFDIPIAMAGIITFVVEHKTFLIHSVSSIPAHPFRGLVLQVFFGQFGLVDAGIWLLTQNFEGLSCWYIFGKGIF